MGSPQTGTLMRPSRCRGACGCLPPGRRPTQRKNRTGFHFPQLTSWLEVRLRGRWGAKVSHVAKVSDASSEGRCVKPQHSRHHHATKGCFCHQGCKSCNKCDLQAKGIFFLCFFKGQCCDSASQPAAPPLPIAHTQRPRRTQISRCCAAAF